MSTASRIFLSEKIGYGLGDMACSMFWKIFSFYLPFFYSNVFGLRLDQVALLLMVTRICDMLSDPLMGMIADRTESRWGKYRPYLLFMAVPFAICGVLLLSSPESLSPTMRLVWAYGTYLLMMVVYSCVNIPYSALLGVMTDDSEERTIFSSFRMIFAYAGSFIVLLAWEPLCNALGGYHSTSGWQHSMIIVGMVCVIIFFLCFLLTKERVTARHGTSVLFDVKSLLHNGPWWILMLAVLCSTLFNTVRGSSVAYYFNDVVGPDVKVSLLGTGFLFYAGLFLSIGEIASVLGASLTSQVSCRIGKKTTYMLSFCALFILSCLFYFVPQNNSGYIMMILIQCIIGFFVGILSPLVWSMYADVADYAENRDGTASTALIISSASMSQKFGGAIGGSFVLMMLSTLGYDTGAAQVQTDTAIMGLKALMSTIPAAISLIAIVCTAFYPLTKERMKLIQSELVSKRNNVKYQD